MRSLALFEKEEVRAKCNERHKRSLDDHITAAEALELANATQPGEWRHRFLSICEPRSGCQRQPWENDPGRWTFYQDCLTVYDDEAAQQEHTFHTHDVSGSSPLAPTNLSHSAICYLLLG